MSEKDEMTNDKRRKYLHKMWGRYRDASKQEKKQKLDDMKHVTGLHRKSIIRILNGRLDTLSHLLIMREIYEDLAYYHNFFQPVMKTIQKIQIDEFRYRRVFDKTRPPFAKYS